MMASSQVQDPGELRRQARENQQQGNWKDALEIRQRLLAEPDAQPSNVIADLRAAWDCQNRLGLQEELDSLLQSVTKLHGKHWKVLATAAEIIQSSPHYGIVADQKFVRSPNRQISGEHIETSEQDRLQSLAWLELAVQRLDASASPVDKARLFLQLANTLHALREGQFAWGLQVKTDLSSQPDYLDLESPRARAARRASVQADGTPIFYQVPANWNAAVSDGERFRWAITQAIEFDKATGDSAKMLWASFLHSQFSVDTLQEDLWIFRGHSAGDEQAKPGQEAEPPTGVFAVHTLGENETIAKLASGIKRFSLPDEHNPIRKYQELAADEQSSQASQALMQLVATFENRRQYAKAAELLKQSIARFGDNGRGMQMRLDNIIKPRGAFDAVPTQPAGQGAKIALLFRNATEVRFTARAVDIEKLLAEMKQFYRDQQDNRNRGFGGSRNTYPPPIHSPNSLFETPDLVRYVKGEVASWEMQLQPRENHWDRRLEITTPLQRAGLYVVTASLNDGAHTARCLVWVQDTAMVRHPLNERIAYFIADANTGRPLANLNVEFFGIGHVQDGNRGHVVTKNFAKRSDASGQVFVDRSQLLDNHQWMAIARSSEGRLAILGLEHTWFAPYALQDLRQIKAFGVSDRPVYRPGDKVHAKFWVARANYAPDTPSTPVEGSPCDISIVDPQGKEFWRTTATTDKFGGMAVEVDLPKTATLGAYHFQVNSGRDGWMATELRFRVEEYRKPEFEVKIQSPDKPIALGEKFTAKIQAKYYFGTPVTEATAVVKVTREKHADQFYPVHPYDWCYGPGYWWCGYEYPWYPGWQSWRGCISPVPPWWPRWRSEPPELVLETELQLDGQGEAEITIDTAVAQQSQANQDHKYSISVEVRDAARRTQSADGQVIAARHPFTIYSWLDRGFYRIGEPITASFQARTLDARPIEGTGKLDLLRITYDGARHPSESLVQSFDVKTDAEGRLEHRLQAQRAGQYRLRLTLKDAAGHSVEGAYLFTVRGTGDSGNDFRFSALELIPNQKQYAPGEKLLLQINADRDDALVMLFVRPSGGVYPTPQFIQLKSKTFTAQIDIKEADQPNFFVEAVTIFDGEVHVATREIFVPPAKRVVDVKLVSDKAEYLPGEQAQVEITATDPEGLPVEGSAVIAVYDRALEQIAPDTIPGDIRAFFWKWQRQHHPQRTENLSWTTYPVRIGGVQQLQSIGIFGDSLADDLDSMNGSKQLAERRDVRQLGRGLAEAVAMDAAGAAPTPMASMGAQGFMAKGAPQDGQATLAPAVVRKEFADAALWLAKIETNRQGKASAKFKMPENLTSWKMKSWVVGPGVRVGSGESDATTRKNLLVRLQTPRFLVERDEVVLSAIVHNDLPVAKDVRVRLEIDGETQLEFLPGVTAERTLNVVSHGQVRVDWRCRAMAEGIVTLRVLAQTDVESDAMQLKTPILVNGILKTNSYAGTVRPDQSKSQVTIGIPEQRRIEHSRLTVRLSPSLAAAMIDALPYLADYPYGCTEQTLNRFLPTVITQKLLREMRIDLNRLKDRANNLNAQELTQGNQRSGQWKRFERNPVYDVDEVNHMVDTGVGQLTDMQNSDGGWGWFSGFQSHSGAHTTAVVVRGLLVAQQNDVAIVPDVIQRGLAWLQQYQERELARLLADPDAKSPHKSVPDNLDALVLHVLTEAEMHNPQMQAILYAKREHLNVYGKSLLALVTHKTGNVEQTAMLRRNIEQFLVEDPENETAYLRDRSAWWYWYGSEIEASATFLKLLATIDPKGPTAARVVKYLLNNRKHATYWASTRDTALVVEAFGDYLKASGETTGNVSAEIVLDGKRLGRVEFSPENLFDVENTIEIHGNAVPSGQHQLEIRKSGNGPLYWNIYSTNFTLEDEIAASGLEVKVERRFYRLEPAKKELAVAGDRGQVIEGQRAGLNRISLADLQALPSGTQVEVELLVESKNDYEYIMLQDSKPAGLEPIDTQSGYSYAGGISVYRELRDQKVTFFIERLPTGKHSLRYRLRAEAPGRFTALPAIVSGMYAPELIGNSADFDLLVEDRE